MNLSKHEWFRTGSWIGVGLLGMALAVTAMAQSISTTSVQGTVYLANGKPGSGTLQLSWPAFTTAANQTVMSGRTMVSVGVDGFMTVNLAPNLGSTPAGLYYTAVYHLSDGTTSTEYWVVPEAAVATIAQIRAQLMPAAQAVQAVSKAYVDQAVQSVAQGNLTSTGGALTGSLFLTGDPSQDFQAADKHYVDSVFGHAVPMTGAAMTGPLTSVQLGAAYQADQFTGVDFGAKLQTCIANLSSIYGGTCDARNFTGNLTMASDLTIATANTTVMLPCATIATAKQVIVPAGTRNVALHGCALRGASGASGSQGGTVFLYSGTKAMVQIGDRSYAIDTPGFHLDNAVINITAATNATAQGLAAYRTQEMDMQSLYFLGNSNQTGMMLDGTGNYTGGTFYDNALNGFQTAVSAVGHNVANSATTDWLNASTFVRLHIDCPTSNGSPISGTYGINLQQGDGNTFTGGDVEGCGTALHLGPNAQNNTIIGLRNENSLSQVVADSGSSYNNWITGGTMFTGKLTDNGTRNSFLDTFHRSFNGMTGDWYGSQQDATVTNHFRIGIGNGNERGLLNRYQTDAGYRWTTGLSDAIAGEQFYQVLDELNNVYRLSIGQYNGGQSSRNNQTILNSAGTGAVVLNGSDNAGTGGVVIGSGGPSETTVATISNGGNAQFNGTMQVGGTTQTAGTLTVRNNADAEVDYYLWPGLTAGQKGAFTYKDWNGNSQWYMVKDASNNWALNSATGGLDSIKAYQSSNSGDTYINASNSSGVVRVNYESGAGTAFNIYGGNSGALYASLTGTTSIKFPGLAASSGRNCLQIDASGYMSNTGIACGAGGSGIVNSGGSGQIAYYSGSGSAVSGLSMIPLTAGGTGATSAAGALAALAGASLVTSNSQTFNGPLNVPTMNASTNKVLLVTAPPYNAKCDGATDDHTGIQAAFNDALSNGYSVQFPAGTCHTSTITYKGQSFFGAGMSLTTIAGQPGQDVFAAPDATFSFPYGSQIHDLSILVDGSVNAASSVVGGNNTFPNRISGTNGGTVALTNPPAPGPVVFGPAVNGGCAGSTTSGSNVFTLGCGLFTGPPPMLVVGAPITINGAGPSGASLVTTISAIVSASQVTLAASASTTVANASGSWGKPLTPPWYFGNCGLAFPDSDASANHSGLNGMLMRDVVFGMYNNGVGKPYVCGIWMQLPSNDMHWDKVDFISLWGGLIEAIPTANSGSLFAWTPDTNTYKDVNFKFDNIPMVTYNGNHRVYDGINIYGGQEAMTLGLMQLAQNGQGTNLQSTITHYYDECWSLNSGEHARFTGQVNIQNGALDQCGPASYIAWYAHDSTVDAAIGALQIYGSGNNFVHSNTGSFTDYGMNNRLDTTANIANGSAAKVFQNRPHDPQNKLDSAFLLTGNSATPFTSGADLLITCEQFNFAFQTGNANPPAGCTNDPTGKEITQSYAHLTSSSYTGWTLGHDAGSMGQGPYGKNLFIGDRLPQAKMQFVIMARCNTVCTHTYYVSDGTAGWAVRGSGSVTFGTSWTIQTFPVDFSTTPIGDSIDISTNASNPWASGNTSEDIAFMAFEPVNTDMLNAVAATATHQFSASLTGPAGSNQLLLLSPMSFTFTVPAACGGSIMGAKTAATASAAFTVKKLAGGPTGASTTLCTATFAATGTSATFTGTGGSLAVGDYLEIDGPATADTTLANIGVSIYVTH